MRKNFARMLAAFTLLLVLPALALAADFAVVTGGRLNLREYASTGSRSLGKYASGSWVQIVGSSVSGFMNVRTLDGKTGYMHANYLNTANNASLATVKYANGGYVNLRSGPSLDYGVVRRITSGTTVSVLNDSYEWNQISVNVGGETLYGYMHDSFLNRSTSTSTVTTQNGGKVNVRSGPSSSYGSIGKLASGTKVSVLLKGNGWYYISGGGLTGFMSTQYLSGTGATLGTNTGSTSTTSTRIAYVNNPRSTQVLNLREYASQSARSIGQYRNGTQVRVVSYGNTWCEVYVGTRHGYMMTRYLSFNGGYVQPTYTQAPSYVYPIYPAATSTPLVQLITPQPQRITPRPQVDVSNTPEAGMYAWLAISAGSSSNTINVYSNRELTQVKATYQPGQQVMILSYGDNVSMVMVNGEIAFVSTWNLNY